MKVSVIIPVYNEEKYIDQCLKSVFAQNIDSYEVICINDGSTDSSLDILKKYENTYSNMVLVSITNHGVGYARNLGLHLAQGKTCCFMDPDDYYPNDTILNTMYEKLTANNVNICGGSTYILRDGELTNPSEKDYGYRFSKDEIVKYKDYQWSYGFWRFLYRIDFLKKNGIEFPLYSRFQDPPFLVKAMICAGQFYALQQETYVYRANSKIMKYTRQKTIDCLKGMIDVLKYSKENNLSKLNQQTLQHVNTWLCMPIYMNMAEDESEFIDLLSEVKANAWEQVIELEVEKKLKKREEIRERECGFWKKIDSYDILILYGAGMVGKKYADYLLSKGYKKQIIFAVSELRPDQDKEYQGIPIVEIASLKEYSETAFVLVTTMQNLHEQMDDNLKQMRFKNFENAVYEELQMFSVL